MRNNTLEKGLLVLETLACEARDFPLVELARLTGLEKSHACRLLQSLVTRGYVIQDPKSRKYRIGLRTLELSSSILARMEMHRQGIAWLHDLADRLNVTTYLGVPHLNQVLVIATVYPAGIYRDEVPGFGSILPFHDSAMGRVIIANMPEELRPETMRDMPELKEINRTGIGVIMKPPDRTPDIVGVASAVRNARGQTIGALGASTDYTHWLELGGDRVGIQVRRAAESLSFALGYAASRITLAETIS